MNNNDPGSDLGSVATEHRDGSVSLLEPLAPTGFKDVCVSDGGDPALAMTEIGSRAKFFNPQLHSVGIKPLALQLLNSFERDGDSGRPPPFGPSAASARLGVSCRLGRRLR